jgi:hypothetical protein
MLVDGAKDTIEPKSPGNAHTRLAQKTFANIADRS